MSTAIASCLALVAVLACGCVAASSSGSGGEDRTDGAADGGGAADSMDGADDGSAPCGEPREYCGAIPGDAMPCTDDGTLWPLVEASALYPLEIHYSRYAQDAEARAVLAILERAWAIETGELGFSPPRPDRGLCGDNDAFDVFLWPGLPEVFVEAIADEPDTPHDDWIAYMAIDPRGPYGGELLGVTLAHELNHACQGADDWFESPFVFEMTATFVEDMVYPEVDDWMTILGDFQSRPDWSIDRDDGYASWYMYSSALYLHFLRERYFAGDAGFVGELWAKSRSPAEGPNEPDFVDAIDEVLSPFAADFLASVVEFSRWRWYTGARDDGQHFTEGARFPDTAEVAVAASVVAAPQSIAVDPRPMLLGSAYVVVDRADGPAQVELTLAGDRRARWVVQALPGPGGSDGEVLDVADGPALLDFSEHASRVVVVTALPRDDYDADDRSDRRFAVALELR